VEAKDEVSTSNNKVNSYHARARMKESINASIVYDSDGNSDQLSGLLNYSFNQADLSIDYSTEFVYSAKTSWFLVNRILDAKVMLKNKRRQAAAALEISAVDVRRSSSQEPTAMSWPCPTATCYKPPRKEPGREAKRERNI
jgi:hypothetical protein